MSCQFSSAIIQNVIISFQSFNTLALTLAPVPDDHLLTSLLCYEILKKDRVDNFYFFLCLCVRTPCRGPLDVCALVRSKRATLHLDCCVVLTIGAGSPAASQIRNSSHLPDNYMLILTVVFEEPAILNEA